MWEQNYKQFEGTGFTGFLDTILQGKGQVMSWPVTKEEIEKATAEAEAWLEAEFQKPMKPIEWFYPTREEELLDALRKRPARK